MLFNSYVFLYLFLPVALLLFQFSLRHGPPHTPTLALIALSLLFYAWWSPLYLLLLLASIAINFCVAHLIHRGALHAARWVILGVGVNLALLGYYKYRGFFSQIINDVADRQLLPMPELFLPLAISFYTFQQIAFLVDVYRRHIDPPPALLDYAAAVTFFPHLIAGPIVQYREILPQFRSLQRRRVSAQEAAQGLALLAVGLFKKTVIADNCGRLADLVFAAPTGVDFGTGDAWLASLAFSLQLYFDFSAYSDMALGLATLFGIKLPMNFNSPYRAQNIADFWRRWHITLGVFLRDYLYVALGGNRKSNWRTMANLFITMALGGLWHGAGWTFLIWGAMHGGYLIVHRAWVGAGMRLHPALAWLLTMLGVLLGWVVFRSDTAAKALEMYRVMLGLTDVSSHFYGAAEIVTLLAASLVVLTLPNAVNWIRGETRWSFDASWFQTGFVAALVCVGLMQVGKTRGFIYFNF